MSTPRAIVVGSGPSGLAAAFRLQQHGHQVTVLEQNDYAGGKIKTVRDRGFVIDTGATLLPSSYKHILGIIQDAGLDHLLQDAGTIVGFARDNGPQVDIHYLDSRRLFIDAARTRLLSTRSKITLIKLAIDSLELRKHLSYEDLSQAAAYDTETAAEYCERRLNAEVFDYLVDTSLRALAGARGDVNSKVDFFFVFNNIIGSGLYGIEGGMSSYTEAIAGKLDVRLSSPVDSVDNVQGKAQVTWRDANGAHHVDTVDSCVLAIPAPATAALAPGLPAECLKFLRSVRYTSNVNINIALTRPTPNVPAFTVQIPEKVHPGLFCVTFDHNKAPGRVPDGRGLLGAYAMSDWSDELMHADDDTITHELLAAVEHVLPGTDNDIDWVRVNRWSTALVYSRAGLYKELAEFQRIRPRTGPIHLAGDYFSCSNLNTSTAAGLRAADEAISAINPAHPRQ